MFIYSRLEAERLAAEAGMRLYRTSVKDDLNVGSVFQHLAENYVNKVEISKTKICFFKKPQSANSNLLSVVITTYTANQHLNLEENKIA